MLPMPFSGDPEREEQSHGCVYGPDLFLAPLAATVLGQLTCQDSIML